MDNSDSTTAMVEAANGFLDVLTQDVAPLATLDIADASRRDWHYIPRRRRGLDFVRMTAMQQKAAYALVATGLSLDAFAAVTTIVGLEDVLDQIEGGTGPRRLGRRPEGWGRHRADYSVTVFGTPDGESWAWSFEGHHVSINVTIHDGEVATTPLFLGANPAEIATSTGYAVTRPLAAEEDLALALLAALEPAQREQAMLEGDIPADILTEAAPLLEELPALSGVRFAALSGSVESLAESLVRQYLDRLPAPIADKRWATLRPHFGDVRFAFSGEAMHRRPHYYRLTGPSFFVEYDNTQDGANHVHTVLRDPDGDFGDDLLRHHRRLEHGV